MADKTIIVDTSILIGFFRKAEKENSILVSLVRRGYAYKISAITDYEIFSGASAMQLDFWNNLLQEIEVIPFDKRAAKIAVAINNELKRKRKQIDMADLFIAATALANNLPVATLNKKHFERIDGLFIIE